MDLLNRAAKVFLHVMHRPTRMLNQVRFALRQHDLESATTRINEAQRRFPHLPDVNHLFVKIQAMNENWDEVRNGIDCIAANPNSNFEQILAAARMFRKLGDDRQAIELYEQLGKQSQGLPAGFAWSSSGHIYMQRSEFENAVSSFIESACKNGGVHWIPAIDALQRCAADSVFKLRESMLERPPDQQETYQFQKLLSLLEQRLVESDRCSQESVIQSMRRATEHALKTAYPNLTTDDSADPLKPSFLIIGAMKCGTTSLNQMICQHPRCLKSWDKEIQFFQFPHLSEQWYLEHFPRVSPTEGYVTGDASPGYYIFDIVERVKTLLPDVKLVFIQRDPVRRALSHMRHNVRVGMVDFAPRQLVNGIDELEHEITSAPENAERTILDITYGHRKQSTFVALGCYELLLRRWKRTFGAERLLTIQLEDLSRSPQDTIEQVFQFIGLESVPISPVGPNTGNHDDSDPDTQLLKDRLKQFYSNVAQATG